MSVFLRGNGGQIGAAEFIAPVINRLEDELTAEEAQAFVDEAAARMETDLLGKLKAGGMAVNEPDKDAFVKASTAIYDEFSNSVPGGKEMVDKAISLAGGA